MGIAQVTINSPTQFFPTCSFFSMSSSPHRNINTLLPLVTGPFWPLIHLWHSLLNSPLCLRAFTLAVLSGCSSLRSEQGSLSYLLQSSAQVSPSQWGWPQSLLKVTPMHLPPPAIPAPLILFLFSPHSTDHLWTCYIIFLFITFIIHCLLFLHQVPWSQNLPCLWSLIYPKCLEHSWHMLGNICWISRWQFYAESQCPKQRKAEPLWLKQRKRAKTPGYS